MKIHESYNLQIWVGLRAHYTETLFDIQDVRNVVDAYIKKNKTCVTITPTEFRYVDGWEPGVIIGLIQYPRFPKKEVVLLEDAKNIALLLKECLHQERITITSPTWTYMLEDSDADADGSTVWETFHKK